MQQRLTLTDTILMELSQHVVGSDMEAIALEYLELEAPTVRNRNEVNKEKREHFNFEILCLWREKSAENTKEVDYDQRLNVSVQYSCTHTHINSLIEITISRLVHTAKATASFVNGLWTHFATAAAMARTSMSAYI